MRRAKRNKKAFKNTKPFSVSIMKFGKSSSKSFISRNPLFPIARTRKRVGGLDMGRRGTPILSRRYVPGSFSGDTLGPTAFLRQILRRPKNCFFVLDRGRLWYITFQSCTVILEIGLNTNAYSNYPTDTSLELGIRAH